MIAKIYSAIPQGYTGQIVEVEGDINQGLPGFNLVGMANKTISEARERVRSAIVNSSFLFPQKKVTVSLAPAELEKDGSHLDLPIALAILSLSQQLLPSDAANRLFVGELALDGTLRPVRGIINIAETARARGYKELFVPSANFAEASLVPHLQIYGVPSLLDLFLHLKGQKYLSPTIAQDHATVTPSQSHVVKITSSDNASSNSPADRSSVDLNSTDPDSPSPPSSSHPTPLLDDIQGQTLAKRALTIAVAGHHNLLFTGPPGAGKTMLARVAASLLPDPSPEEQIDIAKIQSISGLPRLDYHQRPFRAPHHTASLTSIVGGGARATPGEISLAHHGVLFLDELPEYSREVLESLRQPLEDGEITISRARQHVTFPADFMLIATMNPCPCGHADDPDQTCTCSPLQLQHYRSRISGPIRDRIDLIIKVNRVKTQDLSSGPPPSQTSANRPRDQEHNVVKKKILEASRAQAQRYGRPDRYNGSLSSTEITHFIPLSTSVQNLLNSAADRLQLSARSYFKIIKVARTIADLAGATDVEVEHISEALALRHHEC